MKSGTAPLESSPSDESAATRDEVNRCLRALGPFLLRASTTADGPRPRNAIPHLRKALLVLVATLMRLS